jgi:hypothetical protein
MPQFNPTNSTIDNVNNLRKELIDSGIAKDYELVGASDIEINEIEERYGRLPDSYKQIMQLLGRRSGKLVDRGYSEFYIDQTPIFTEYVLEKKREALLEGDGVKEYSNLPDNVFFVNADDRADYKEFILTNTGRASPVYGYGFPYGRVGEVNQLFPSVWGWIENLVNSAKREQRLHRQL